MPQSTQEVLDHHLQAFDAGNVEEALSDYSPQSFVILPDGSILKGLDQIKGGLEMFIGEFSKPGVQFNIGFTRAEGEVAFITWSAETLENSWEFGADTLVIREGKIVGQTIGAKVTPKK